MIETVNEYVCPVGGNAIEYVVDETSSGSHEGKYKGSIDFAVPIGTVVLAGGNGKVVRVRVDSERHGTDPSFGMDANYITIEHAKSEYSEYLHLAKDSALVEVGDEVHAGQQIAATGLSGWMFAPHLHFMVYVKEDGFTCRKIKFIDDTVAKYIH